MTPLRISATLPAFAVAFLLLPVTLSSAATYEQDFTAADGTTDLDDGSTIGSNDGVNQVIGNALRLTSAANTGTRASYRIPALADSSQGWTATFDYVMSDTPGGNPPADGFSLSYGDIPALTTNGAANTGHGAAEAGMGGIVIAFQIDTWQNNNANSPGVGILENGNPLPGGRIDGTVVPTDGTVSGTATITWSPNTATFRTSGLANDANFTDLPHGFVGNDSYSWAFSARTGGATQDLIIDNLRIVTGAVEDSDGDGLPNTYEVVNNLDPNDDGTIGESSPGAKDGPNGALGDPDGDNLTNSEERSRGTSPRAADTDNDGLNDDVEDGGGIYVSTTRTGTDPLNPDSDGDILLDGVENPELPFVDANQPGTDPNKPDTDGDLTNDGFEINRGRNPTVPDTSTTYVQEFTAADGTTDLQDGSTIGSSDGVSRVVNNALQITSSANTNTRSSFRIPALTGSSQGWIATFDYTLTDVAGGNPPADGFTLNYGDIPPLTTGGGQNTGHGAAEAGMGGNVISFQFDTWQNGNDNSPGVGILVAGTPLPGGRIDGTVVPTDGSVSGTATIIWTPDDASFTTTGLTTNANFSILPHTFTGNDSYGWAFSARTGGATEDLIIDNLSIETGAPGDSDGDGLSDAYENANGLDPNDDGTAGESTPGAKDGPNGALGDPDADGITNTEERDRGTNPTNNDTDNDGLTDGVEDGNGIFISGTQTGTDPLNPDSDGDGLLDGVENPNLPFVDAEQPGTDPNNPDTDGDGATDRAEAQIGRDPTFFTTPPTTYCNNFDSYPDGTKDLLDLTVINGAAASVEGGQLRLTIDGEGLGASSFSVPALAGSSSGWKATFDYTLIDAIDEGEPADGFSLNYGNAAVGELGAAEEGMGNIGSVTENLSLEVDTYDNNENGVVELGVNVAEKTDGVDISLADSVGAVLLDGETRSGTVTISWDPVNGASFSTTGLNNDANFVNVPTSFVADDSHTFIISTRVGGANETLLIDNLCITTEPPGRTQFELRNTGDDLEFRFATTAGKFYDIRSSTDPEAEPDPATWAIWQADLEATPPLNVNLFPRPVESRRFFVIQEKDAPPFFFEDFESGATGWTTGSEPDDAGTTSWELGSPNGTDGPASGADGSANAYTTAIGDYAPNANIFLRSPPINLGVNGITTATLVMQQFRDADTFGDFFGIRLRRADDLSELATIDPDPTIVDDGWGEFTATIPPEALGREILLEFWFTSDATLDLYSGWSIDNVSVEIE